MFQSTPPRGGRLGWGRLLCNSGSVSIHAPARGATLATNLHTASPAGFNPRPRAGGDSLLQDGLLVLKGFNPRPRAGGDVTAPFAVPVRAGFNPRPRAGGDLISKLLATQ